MLRYNFDKIKNVVICGSFRKHWNQILEIIEKFEEKGLKVLSPKKSEIISDEDGFVRFKDDACDKPNELENLHLEEIEKADVLYICNIDGYIGASTMFEIGYALKCGHIIYFLEKPNEIIFDEISKNFNGRNMIKTPEELCVQIGIENKVWSDREYFDAYYKKSKMIKL